MVKLHAEWVNYEWTTFILRGEALTDLSVEEVEKFLAEEEERQHPGLLLSRASMEVHQPRPSLQVQLQVDALYPYPEPSILTVDPNWIHMTFLGS